MTTAARSRRATSNRKGDDNERALLATAERLLRDAPLQDISVEALARGAGISRSSFYFYFRSKDDVLLALVDRLTSELEQVVAAFAGGMHDDPAASIAGGIGASARAWHDHGHVFRALLDASAGDEHVREVWNATLRRFIDVNAQAIQAERDAGAAPAGGPSALELATALVLLNERAHHAVAVGAAPALAGDRAVPVLTQVWLHAIYGVVPA